MVLSMTAIAQARNGVTNGYAATLEEAKVKFRKGWEGGENAPAARSEALCTKRLTETAGMHGA